MNALGRYQRRERCVATLRRLAAGIRQAFEHEPDPDELRRALTTFTSALLDEMALGRGLLHDRRVPGERESLRAALAEAEDAVAAAGGARLLLGDLADD